MSTSRKGRPEGDSTRPWLGLESYSESDRERFYGRDRDVDMVRRLVRRDQMTLLFGASGVGKTSLLQAGLLAEERKEDALPVYVRLDHGKGAPRLRHQVLQAIQDALVDSGGEGPEPADDDTLWTYLHRRDAKFWSRNHRLMMPLIVLDQFEEFFSHGLSDRERADDCRSFAEELADLVADRPPAAVRDEIDRSAEAAEQYDVSRRHYKFVVSIDDGYVGKLDHYPQDFAPGLFNNRWRLEPMTKAQAADVVAGPGEEPWIQDEKLGKAIIGHSAYVTGDGREVVEDNPWVDPSVLSVLLWRLDRSREGGAIQPGLVEEYGSAGLLGFYEDSLEGISRAGDWGRWWRWGSPRRLHDYIERRFLNEGDLRTPQPSAQVFSDLGRSPVDTLVDRHILAFDRRVDPPRVELAHHVLAEHIRLSGRKRSRKREIILLILLLFWLAWALIATGILLWPGQDSSSGDGPSGASDPDPASSGVPALVIETVTTGEDPGPDPYQVSVGDSVRLVLPNGVVGLGHAASNVRVQLSEVADHCTVQGENPREVELEPRDTKREVFVVVCGATEDPTPPPPPPGPDTTDAERSQALGDMWGAVVAAQAALDSATIAWNRVAADSTNTVAMASWHQEALDQLEDPALAARCGPDGSTWAGIVERARLRICDYRDALISGVAISTERIDEFGEYISDQSERWNQAEERSFRSWNPWFENEALPAFNAAEATRDSVIALVTG